QQRACVHRRQREQRRRSVRGGLAGGRRQLLVRVHDVHVAAEPGEQQLLRPVRLLMALTVPAGSFSWQTNRSQNAVQVFYYVNKFHDHLLAAPIGFTEAAGNFQTVNSTGQGLGDDENQTEPLDGANTLCCVGGQ